ncbi:hypothetical protein [Bradyrhizobium sp. AZCC 2289]|uniref:hypothetical protein n=1 Tax=Bradyrhizobium sp. AZCC 2289 TaxID=3117026 RepID=UPI002FEE75DB
MSDRNPVSIYEVARVVAQMGTAAIGLQNFATLIIDHVNAGGPLDEQSLVELGAACIRNVKNGLIEGIPLEDDAETMRLALETLQKFLNGVIHR